MNRDLRFLLLKKIIEKKINFITENKQYSFLTDHERCILNNYDDISIELIKRTITNELKEETPEIFKIIMEYIKEEYKDDKELLHSLEQLNFEFMVNIDSLIYEKNEANIEELKQVI